MFYFFEMCQHNVSEVEYHKVCTSSFISYYIDYINIVCMLVHIICVLCKVPESQTPSSCDILGTGRNGLSLSLASNVFTTSFLNSKWFIFPPISLCNRQAATTDMFRKFVKRYRYHFLLHNRGL